MTDCVLSYRDFSLTIDDDCLASRDIVGVPRAIMSGINILIHWSGSSSGGDHTRLICIHRFKLRGLASKLDWLEGGSSSVHRPLICEFNILFALFKN